LSRLSDGALSMQHTGCADSSGSWVIKVGFMLFLRRNRIRFSCYGFSFSKWSRCYFR
jgi:hypothetical protein